MIARVELAVLHTDVGDEFRIKLWGYNPRFTRLTHATAAVAALKRGMRLIVVDPRHVVLASKADLWLRVRPGTDGALALGITSLMIERGWYDRDFIRDWSNGPHLVRADTGRLLIERDLTPDGNARRLLAWDTAAARFISYDTVTGRRYRDQLVTRLGLADVRTITPGPRRLAAADAQGMLWLHDPDACCAVRKVEPLVTRADQGVGQGGRRLARRNRRLTAFDPGNLAGDAGEERGRFIRHLRPWWDVHRHRIPPEVADRIENSIARGQLVTVATCIRKMQAVPNGVNITHRPLRANVDQHLFVRRVVNCSGPACDYERIATPLIRSLLDRGDIRPDTLRLGLDISSLCALGNRRGEIWQRLYAVGPVTRSAFWEVTSVSDIRRQCETLAAHLSARLAVARPASAILDRQP